MRKWISALAILMCAALLAGCQQSAQTPVQATPAPAGSETAVPIPPQPTPGLTKDTLKIGVLYAAGEWADKSDSLLGVKDMLNSLGMQESQCLTRFGVSEGDAAAAVRELTDAGCDIVFGTDAVYAPGMLEGARQNPDIEFCVAGGPQGESGGMPNYHTCDIRMFEGRYLLGIAAGMKTQSDHIGYVAPGPDRVVADGMAAFYLGAKSVNPEVVMDVVYTEAAGMDEAGAAQALIELGADVIAAHWAGDEVALAAQQVGVWQVGYGAELSASAQQAALLSTRAVWSVYMTYAVQCVLNGEPIQADWSGGLAEDAVSLTRLNEQEAAMGTWEAIADAKARLEAGALRVFGDDAAGDAEQQVDAAATQGADGSPFRFAWEGAK